MSKYFHLCSHIGDLYMSLEELFVADPMLLHVVLALCPEKDYSSILTMVPTYLSLTLMSLQPKKIKTVNWGDVSISCYIIECIRAYLVYGSVAFCGYPGVITFLTLPLNAIYSNV